MVKFWSFIFVLSAVLAVAVFFPKVATAAQVCADWRWHEKQYIKCSRPSDFGYCLIEKTEQVRINCNKDNNCTSSRFQWKTSKCNANDSPGDINAVCNGDLGYYGDVGGYITTQCWTYCNENQWSACSATCGGGTQTNGCGQSRACNTQPCCNTTAPTNLSVTRLSSTSSRIDWTRGNNGTSQRLYVGSDKAKVETNCPSGVGQGTGCVIKEEGLGSSLQTYTTGGVLSPGTVYYWRIVTYQSSTCSSASSTLRSISSCTLSSGSLALEIFDSVSLTALISSSSEINRVDFTPGSSAITVDPASDTVYPYATTVTGAAVTSPDFTDLTQSVYFTGSATPACTDTLPVIVSDKGPWWQVQDSDVAARSSLNSSVPPGSYFNLPGDGGYPGVASFGTSTNLTTARVSETGWQVNSQSVGDRT